MTQHPNSPTLLVIYFRNSFNIATEFRRRKKHPNCGALHPLSLLLSH